MAFLTQLVVRILFWAGIPAAAFYWAMSQPIGVPSAETKYLTAIVFFTFGIVCTMKCLEDRDKSRS